MDGIETRNRFKSTFMWWLKKKCIVSCYTGVYVAWEFDALWGIRLHDYLFLWLKKCFFADCALKWSDAQHLNCRWRDLHWLFLLWITVPKGIFESWRSCGINHPPTLLQTKDDHCGKSTPQRQQPSPAWQFTLPNCKNSSKMAQWT